MTMARERDETSPIDVLDRAFSLAAGQVAAVLTHFLGSVPFLIGLLWFLDDMRTSRNALDRCLPEACGVALLYLWMNYCRARFSGGLRARLDGKALPEWTFNEAARLLATQCRFQGLKLAVMPFAASSLIAWPWTTAFFRNITNVAAEPSSKVVGLSRIARSQATLWQRQNVFIFVLIALISVILFANIGLMLILVPQLARMFSGVENPFTRSPARALNTTLVLVDMGLCWLLLDPIVEAVYVIRCFEGQSLRTGEDLLAQLRRIAAGVVFVLLFTAGLQAQAQAQAQPVHAVSSAEWTRAVNQALEADRYRWSVPKALPKEDGSALWRGMEGLANAFEQGLKTTRHWTNTFVRWLARTLGLNRNNTDGSGSGGTGPSGTVGALVYLLTALIGASLLVVVWRMWPRARAKPLPKGEVTVVDLASDNLLANQLPEEQWFELAERCLSGGDMRLGLRALFLASLAYLDGRTLIAIHASKSNREYLHELRRNARARARDPRNLVDHFFSNLGSFEQAWYGMHDVSPDQIATFRANLSGMRACAE
jgi:hypothetical protein